MKDHFDNKYIDDIDEEVGNNYFTPILNHVVSQINVKMVCDIGCGNGVFTGDLKQKISCNLLGVDSSKYALEKASQLDFDELIQVDDFNKDRLPIDDKSVDFVICKDVLEHLIDPIFLTNEIYRILKPNGYLLVHVPNHFPIWGRLKFLFTNNIDTFSYFPSSNRHDFPHIRFFTLSGMRNLLKISSFNIVENLSFFFSQPPLLHRIMPIWFRKFLTKVSTDNFSEGITILAKKMDKKVEVVS
jgi:SAM-dependent methyltransferase